jgi:hypothetical protein
VNERRAHERVPVSLLVQFTLDDDVVRCGSLENISEGGMLLVSPESIRPGERIRIMFSEPGSETAIELLGRIVRTATVGTFGVAFVAASQRALAFVENIVGRAAPVM